MIRSKAMIGAFAVSLASSAAFGADVSGGSVAPVAPAIAPVAAWSWTGVYAGARAGYGFGGEDRWGIANRAGMLNANVGEVGLRGGQFGAFAGYNWQLAGTATVLGVEGDVTAGRMSRSTQSAWISPFAASFAGRSVSDWNGSLRLRAGFAYERALVYATGGVAFIGNRYTGAVGGNAVVWNKSDTPVGWTIGGGVDYAMTNALFAGAEYRYTGTDAKRVFDTTNTVSTNRTPDFHSLTLRLGAKF